MLKVNKKDMKKVVGSILGGEDESELDLNLSHSKFVNIKKHCTRFRDTLHMLAGAKTMELLPVEREILVQYVATLDENIMEVFGSIPDISHIIDIYPILTKEQQVTVLTFLKSYNIVKKSTLVNTILATCNNLVKHKMQLSDKATLSDKFLVKSSLMTFNPVVDLNINFKMLYLNDRIGDMGRTFVLLVLHKLYEVSYHLYEEYGKVDVNTENFVTAVAVTIGDLRKKIPRCGGAFDKILESTSLLKDNYGDYYKSYVSSNNSMMIAENFIHDVARGVNDSSPKLAMQFKRIIKYLKDMTARISASDPKYKEAFGALLDHADSSYTDIKKSLADAGTPITEADEDADDDADYADDDVNAEDLLSALYTSNEGVDDSGNCSSGDCCGNNNRSP
jgi:hypothetical protein